MTEGEKYYIALVCGCFLDQLGLSPETVVADIMEIDKQRNNVESEDYYNGIFVANRVVWRVVNKVCEQIEERVFPELSQYMEQNIDNLAKHVSVVLNNAFNGAGGGIDD